MAKFMYKGKYILGVFNKYVGTISVGRRSDVSSSDKRPRISSILASVGSWRSSSGGSEMLREFWNISERSLVNNIELR